MSRAVRNFVRLGFIAVTACALFVVVSEVHARPQVSLASSTVPNLARSCFNVLTFGADPTGANDSTKPFQDALLAASLQNGGAVCVPAGTFHISRLTLLSPGAVTATPGGPSLYGAGPGVTVLVATGSGDVFDSCPGYANVTGNTPPPFCPSPLPMYPVGSPYPGSQLKGVVLSNFTIQHSPAPNSSPASDFSFPYVQGLLVDNVCVSKSNNVFDLGERTSTTAYTSITIRDSSCGYSYTGHFMALHGSGSNISVRDNVSVC